MKIQVKPWVLNLNMYEPGLPIEEVARRFGFPDADAVLKLASNENALGPSPRAVQAMRKAARKMHLYPDGGAYYLRSALSERLGIGTEHILVGHGSNELIVFLGHAFLEPGVNLVMADRAFAVYRLVAGLYRADVIDTPMPDFTHDLDALRAAVTPETRLVFVANPNNPTGTRVRPEDLDRFVSGMPDEVTIVLDEAYIELLPPDEQPDTVRYVREGRNVILLRTFSKTYGLAGLRIGYAIGPTEAIEAFNRVRQPFNVNAMAQAAAAAALEDDAHVDHTRRMVKSGLHQWEKGLDRLGIPYVPSSVNFLLAETGRGRDVVEALQLRGVIVRPMGPYGLPDHVRITVGRRSENVRALQELEHFLKNRGTP